MKEDYHLMLVSETAEERRVRLDRLRKEFNSSPFRHMLTEKVPKDKCCNCGSTKNLEWHHIVPLANGGTNNITNICVECRLCHDKSHQKAYHPEFYENVKFGRHNKIDTEHLIPLFEQLIIGNMSVNDFVIECGYSPKSHINDIRPFRQFCNELGFDYKKVLNKIWCYPINGNKHTREIGKSLYNDIDLNNVLDKVNTYKEEHHLI